MRRINTHTVTDREGNITETKQTYWSLRQELRADLEDRWKPIMAGAFPNGIDSITNIDEFRSEFDAERASRLMWRMNGLTTTEINNLRDSNPKMYRMMWLLTKMIVEATFWHWNGIPGMDNAILDKQEDV